MALSRIALFSKPTQTDPAPFEKLIRLLESLGFEVRIGPQTAELLKGSAYLRPSSDRLALAEWADLGIVLGGDGTMLSVARDWAPYDRPIVGINTGRLGFITDMTVDNMETVLPRMLLENRFKEDRREMLEGSLWRGDTCLGTQWAVNDIGFSTGRVGGMVEVMVSVNGVQMSWQLADGFICSTTTGSTAYALAAGGPLMHPSLNGLLLVPVAPHTLSNRPMVLPGDSEIELLLTDARDAVAYFDMQCFMDAKPGDTLKIKKSPWVMTLWHPEDWEYFSLLRRKLNWSFMPGKA